jgi:hypothetical protein
MCDQRVCAKVTVDLGPLGKGKTECEGTLQWGQLEQPEYLSIAIGGLSAAEINKFTEKGNLTIEAIFGDKKIVGLPSNGQRFDAEIVFIRDVEFGANEIVLNVLLGSYSERVAEFKANGTQWKFGLANLRLFHGDVFTPIPAAKEVSPEKQEIYKALIAEWHKEFGDKELTEKEIEERYSTFKTLGGARCNRVEFEHGGHRWQLDDVLFGRWPDDLKKIRTPIVSGALSTERAEGETEKDVRDLATDITLLLTLALGRDVKWTSFGCYFPDGSTTEVQYRNPGLMSFNQHSQAVADNWEGGNLKAFLESAGRVIIAEREWWLTTIGLVNQARTSRYLEVKCSLLNTLLDRITTKIIGPATNAEIESGLKQKVDAKEFQTALHDLLMKLTDKWDINRTKEICRTINDWNARPSFPKKIIRSCEKLGIPPIPGKKLGFRHVLIHEGEMHSDLDSEEERVRYFFEIEMVVLLLLIRMLGFEGLIYLDIAPPDPKKVSDFLTQTPEGTK